MWLHICNTAVNISDCCSLYLPEGNQLRADQEVTYIGGGLASCQNKTFEKGVKSFQVTLTRTAICCYGDMEPNLKGPCGTRDDKWEMKWIKFKAGGTVYNCKNEQSTKWINYVDYTLTPSCSRTGQHSPTLNQTCVEAPGNLNEFNNKSNIKFIIISYIHIEFFNVTIMVYYV